MVSEQKAEVDEVKGKTLEEISAVVEQINTQITSRKQKLAPQIKELRTLRTKFQELETEYLEKKGLYDNQARAAAPHCPAPPSPLPAFPAFPI